MNPTPSAVSTPDEPNDWRHLQRYGFAPGNYMSKCGTCGFVVCGLDKRASCCRTCAERKDEAGRASLSASPAGGGAVNAQMLEALRACAALATGKGRFNSPKDVEGMVLAAITAAEAAQAQPATAESAEHAEVEALRNLADHAKFEAAMMGACDGSMLAQRAACLEWLACGAEYRLMLRGGPRGGDLLAAEQNLVKQIGFLARNWTTENVPAAQAQPAAPAAEASLDARIKSLAAAFTEDYEGAFLRQSSVEALRLFVNATGIEPPNISAESTGMVIATWRGAPERSASIRFVDWSTLHYALHVGKSRTYGVGTATAAPATPPEAVPPTPLPDDDDWLTDAQAATSHLDYECGAPPPVLTALRNLRNTVDAAIKEPARG